MVDVLVRGIDQQVLDQVDAIAARLGISRAEFIRRQLEQSAQRSARRTRAEDLQQFERLEDVEWMRGAWS